MDRDPRRILELNSPPTKIVVGDIIIQRKVGYTRFRDWRVLERPA